MSSTDKRSRKRGLFPVVGIGASAGGLDAFEKFFTAMPADSGMAFVLVQHLDPHPPEPDGAASGQAHGDAGDRGRRPDAGGGESRLYHPAGEEPYSIAMLVSERLQASVMF